MPTNTDITPKYFASKMAEYAAMDDAMRSHEYADNLMCLLLGQLGYAQGIDIFSRMDKWYA